MSGLSGSDLSGRGLSVRDLKVTLPVGRRTLNAVRGVSFDVAPGRTLCLVGESGCGKSMTALALMGLLPRQATRQADAMRFAELDLAGMSDRRFSKVRGRRISMIFQDPMTSLNPSYTIGNQLEEAYLIHMGGGRKAATARAIEMLGKVGIADPENRLTQYPHQLSGGLRQRVMIAMGLMCEPELLIADEPTTALDVHVQVQILRVLADLQKDLGLAILLITHDLGLVARFADDVAVMYAGRIVESGPVGAVFAAPAHPYTRGLLDCIPVPGATQRGAPLGAIPGIVPSLLGEVRGCAFRERCPHVMPRCADEVDVHERGGGHAYECNLPFGAERLAVMEGRA